MYSNLVSAVPLALAALFCFLFSSIRASNVPYPGETIGHLFASLDASTNSDPSYSTDAKLNTTSNSNSTDAQHEVTKRTYEDHLLFTSYNSSDGTQGYNISMPGNICVNTVAGDFETPSGRFIPNATFLDVFNAMDLRSEELRKYTLTRALALESKFKTTLSHVVCGRLPDRELLSRFRYTDTDVEGFWTAFILAGGGITGIAYGGLYGAISRESRGDISIKTEAWLLTVTAIGQYILITAVFRLQHLKVFNKIDAMLLNLFIIIGEIIASVCQAMWSGVCAPRQTLQSGIRSLRQAALNSMQVFSPNMRNSASPSTLDLINLEEGNQPPPEGQACP